MCNPNMNAFERTEAALPLPATNLYQSLIYIVPNVVTGACKCPKSAAFINPPTHQPSHHHYHYREIFSEAKSLIYLCFPIGIVGLLLYTNSVVSMLFLSSLGELELTTGSLAISFANITGYSVISVPVLGMELLCALAYGARWPKLLSLTLHRGILFLLSSPHIHEAGPGDHQTSTKVPPFLPPRPRHLLRHPLHSHIIADPGHHPPYHHFVLGHCCLSRPGQSPPRHSPTVGLARRRRRLQLLCPRLRRLLPVHCLVGHVFCPVLQVPLWVETSPSAVSTDLLIGLP